MTIEKAIQRSIEKHGNKYDYSKVSFKKVTDKVTIICPIHGEFRQTMRQHYRGQGCPKCGVHERSEKKRDSTQSFIEKARKIWGDTYDYSKVEYVDSKTPVTLICPIHGEFSVVPNGHLSSHYGCPVCGSERSKNARRKTQEEFVKQAKEVHGEKYDYSKIRYINNHEKVTVTCLKHGDFDINPYSLIAGHGCPVCAREKQAKEQTMTSEEFIFNAKKKHGNKYDYSKVHYVDCKTPVTITCPVHGDFQQVPYYHLYGNACPACGVRESKAENEIYEKCCEWLGSSNVVKHTRKEIYPYEIDIYIPQLKIGIEYNGILWHSDRFNSDKDYHLKKLNKCNENGLKLIQVFEDEYENNRNIVLNKIKHILGCCGNDKRVYARKCTIKEIYRNDADTFLFENHIQGPSNSSIFLGAYDGDTLIGVMTFKKESKENCWELTRFATLKDVVCCGVAGKLFSYFVRNYNPSEVKSFADRRWTLDKDTNVYTKLGFKLDKVLKPDYRYFKHSDGIIRQHKFGFRKQMLHKKYGLPLTMTESEMTKKLGYSKVYDCGLLKYVWLK